MLVHVNIKRFEGTREYSNGGEWLTRALWEIRGITWRQISSSWSQMKLLQNDLVLITAVQFFVRKNNWVENDDLGGDLDIRTWEKNKKNKKMTITLKLITENLLGRGHWPITVIEGLSLPSVLKRSAMSSLANGLLGLGSLGVPSTRVHWPTMLFHPTMVYRMQLWSCKRWCHEQRVYHRLPCIFRWEY